jgi:hypothetical protein
MVYHIYFSQEGRSYSMLMFLGMLALYFFVQHLKKSKRKYLLLVALFFAILFYTSYSSIPFIIFSQILWFYNTSEDIQERSASSFLVLNGLLFLFCLPWLLFVASNYRGQPTMDPHHIEDPGSLWSILYWVFNDWVSNLPLIIISVILLILFPFFSKNKKNALILLAVLIFPMGSLYLFCKFLNITHFFASKYFITLLPLFLISIYLSLNAIEIEFKTLKRFMRPKILFTILLITSNLVFLPLYYRSEKQDLRGLVTYLKTHFRDGDSVFVRAKAYLPGILHYLGANPKGRHYAISFSKDSEKGIEYRMVLVNQNKTLTIYNSENCCTQYVADRNRLWIVVEKATAKEFIKNSPCVLKGYFDGSVANFRKFPTDASMYLFLWDPQSPNEKGINMPVE